MEVAPDRLPRWLSGFQQRHGPLVPPAADANGAPMPPAVGADRALVLTAADGTTAELHPPPGAPDLPDGSDLDGFLAGAQAPRRLGLLLARRSAAAVGVADGDRLAHSKVGSWYVQGRTAAGGQSQQRFARRRENQAAAAAGRATELVLQHLLPAAADLAALVTGGDRGTVETILADRRLARLAELKTDRHLPVPTPNLAVLRAAVPAARAVYIHLPPG